MTDFAPPSHSSRALLRKVDAREGTYRIVGWNLDPGIVDATEKVRSRVHPTTEITFRTSRVAGSFTFKGSVAGIDDLIR